MSSFEAKKKRVKKNQDGENKTKNTEKRKINREGCDEGSFSLAFALYLSHSLIDYLVGRRRALNLSLSFLVFSFSLSLVSELTVKAEKR